ncbi:MAG: hypothetical protein DWQ31_13560 [Planctomycetota bacterium]|nr:MAG: hypothetical protein DWQ31_13560 [Planctomycetota bacterium]REJ90301.1 MAG: hypothetical protein DWQ35_16610 [Planctomycetota bacterium]REK17812.1 MAG: hypothetical protein DWQ42_21680 [Planctomycetota bacterium]REK40958.1 MAG: hypothetical protein DWQ46_14830 [Planctomycetota bacterium]
MNVQQFLEHHGIASNPFADEDAQTDQVFKERCLRDVHHPTWDKIYGDPAEPATSVVFGEKGAGKTAIRLQIVAHLDAYNRDNAGRGVYVITYDDLNPFLDRFRDTLSSRRRRPDRVLSEWKLWDHIDAVLSLGVTSLVDQILEVKHPSGIPMEVSQASVQMLDRNQARDLLLLAACYDTSTAETVKGRWHRLRRRLRFRTFRSFGDMALGLAVTAAALGLTIALQKWEWLTSLPLYLIILAGWLPRMWRVVRSFWRALGIVRHVRIGNRGVHPLRQVLAHFTTPEIANQPLPNKQRTDDRFELLDKFQGILQTLGFSGVIVLVDRVDEPHLINGSAEQMRAFLWPMLDNKFLKHPGLGLKLLLPIDLTPFLDREDRDFFQRSRLDKQNMIRSLEWTGEALYDVACARISACAAPERSPSLMDLFADEVSEARMVEAMRSLRVPRNLFKFMYQLFVEHCNAYTETQPEWKISSERFEAVLAVAVRDQDKVERGLRAG